VKPAEGFLSHFIPLAGDYLGEGEMRALKQWKTIQRAMELRLISSYGVAALLMCVAFWIKGPVLLYEGNISLYSSNSLR
jgi:hypothetical protein